MEHSRERRHVLTLSLLQFMYLVTGGRCPISLDPVAVFLGELAPILRQHLREVGIGGDNFHWPLDLSRLLFAFGQFTLQRQYHYSTYHASPENDPSLQAAMTNFYAGRPTQEHMWRDLLNTPWPRASDMGEASGSNSQDRSPPSSSPVVQRPTPVPSSTALQPSSSLTQSTENTSNAATQTPEPPADASTTDVLSDDDMVALADILDQYAGDLPILDQTDIGDIMDINYDVEEGTQPR